MSPFAQLTNKTGKHKDWYGSAFVKIFCEQIHPQEKIFSNAQFINRYNKKIKSLSIKTD